MENERTLLIDIETFPNKFILGLSNIDGIRWSFEITETTDQRSDLYDFLCKYRGFWVGFNSIDYDNVVLAYAQQNKWWPTKTPLEVCQLIKSFSDDVITTRNGNAQKRIKIESASLFGDDAVEKLIALDNEAELVWQKKFRRYLYYFKWTDIDFLRYWSKLLRISRKISLKSLGIQLNYPVTQELPYPHTKWLTEDEWNEVKIYNLQHDLGILLLLTKAMREEVVLRHTILKQTGLPCWSLDAPKIASELLLRDYADSTGMDLFAARNLRFEKPDVLLGDLLKNYDFKFTNPTIVDLYSKLCQTTNVFDMTIPLFNADGTGFKVTVANGGIHAVNENEEYFSDEEYVLVDSDIALRKWRN